MDDNYQLVRNFLRLEEWAVYRVKNGKFFGDTAFGPMWKNFPEDIDTSGLELNSYREVREFLGDPIGSH